MNGTTLAAVSSPRRTTQNDPSSAEPGAARPREPVPGLVRIFAADQPRCDVLPLQGAAIEIGRDAFPEVPVDDAQMSRRHTSVRREGSLWHVEDLDSMNGTSVDGERLTGPRSGALRLVRAGSSLFLIQDDVEPFRAGVSTIGGVMLGPTLVRVWDAIGRAARFGPILHIHGESGTGKEHAARAFHGLGPRSGGPFIAVNCAAIPEGLAERLLFGARKGAFSGATADVEGYVQAAHGGVLFLDEVAELDLAVQAKLLRALESKEVMPLGAARPVKVDFAVVSATHKDLRAQVAAGKLRADLFFRIARPEIRLPTLHERPEEIPWLVGAALRSAGASGAGAEPLLAHASLIEACLARAWPGNVRELLSEIGAAAQEARSAGSRWVQAAHLSPSAGQAFGVASMPPASQSGLASMPPTPRSAKDAAEPSPLEKRAVTLPADEVIEEALRREGGNISRAARALGLHRTQLNRWRARRSGGGEPGSKE